MTYHVASGEVLAEKLCNDQIIDMLDNQSMLVNIEEGGIIVINDYSEVLQQDIIVSNGIAHGINYVLIPPNFKVEEFLKDCKRLLLLLLLRNWYRSYCLHQSYHWY